MFKIEKGIQIPKSVKTRYPIRELEVGESFFVPTEDELDRSKKRNSINGVIRGAKTGNKKEFTLRSVDDSNGIGLRCWRIK